MIASIRNPHVAMLIELAQGDASALQYPLPDAIFGFHAQQSCEKLLKAVISSHGGRYPFTHSLEELTKLLQTRYGESLPVASTEFDALEPFAITFRYQAGPVLTPTDRATMRQTVADLSAHVVTRVLALEAANLPPVQP